MTSVVHSVWNNCIIIYFLRWCRGLIHQILYFGTLQMIKAPNAWATLTHNATVRSHACSNGSEIYRTGLIIFWYKKIKKKFFFLDLRQIEDLTQYINRCEIQINDLYDETEDLREKLGLDPKEPIDLTQYRKKKGLRMQEERALNRVLQKEVRSRTTCT